jgi:low affinity Fe/Cu permease
MARVISQFTGSTTAFLIAALVVLIWAATGPLFHYSSTWQLVINTGTTIATFLMVFLIQRTQNKDSLAVQLKLNEMVAALEGASNRLVNVEDLSEDELSTLHRHYEALAEMSRTDIDVHQSHSVDEAQARHRAKAHHRGKSTLASATDGPGPRNEAPGR